MPAAITRVRLAQAADLDAIVRLVPILYGHDIPFDEPVVRAALGALLADGHLGRVWVAEADETVVGYLVLTFGYSIEFGGRDALVDELLIASEWRNHGLGTQALERAEESCRELGIRAIHLEVDLDNERAHKLYRSRGYAVHARHLMTRWLDR